MFYTIPQDILDVSGEGSKPDLVLIDRINKKIALLELTCPLQSNINGAHQRKLTKYTQLEIALEEKGFKVFLMPFEVGSSGHINKHTRQNIINTLKQFNIILKTKVFENLGKISLLCTMSVFHAYQTNEWASPPLLTP